MKKYIFILMLGCGMWSACDSDKDRILFDPDNGQTLLSFDKSSVDLAILINDAGAVEVVINSSLEQDLFHI